MKKLVILSAVLIFVLACEIPGLAPQAPSSSAPVSIETIIAGTAGAAQKQTAIFLPPSTKTATLTPLPTATPTETPTPTVTVIFIIPTSTKPFVPYDAGAGCSLVGLEPYNPHLNPGESVEITWKLRNTGNGLWLENDLDFRFSGGTDMHKKDVYDLPNSAPPKGEITMTVAMVAPRKAGTYTTNWTLGSNKQTICKVSATIIVK